MGDPHAQVSRGLRVQQWSKRLATVVAEEPCASPYFAAAYRIDPTGTAAQLLRLRDDPRRVLELLTLGSGPFMGRAGRRLGEVLCERPGLGSALWTGAKQELSEEEQARVEVWIESPRLDPEGAPREELLEVAERVLDRIGNRGAALLEPSWQAAAVQTQDFVDALHMDRRARLARSSVEQLLQDLTEEASRATFAVEEAGRIEHVDSPERLLAARDRVVGWGFVGEAAPPRPAFRQASSRCCAAPD